MDSKLWCIKFRCCHATPQWFASPLYHERPRVGQTRSSKVCPLSAMVAPFLTLTATVQYLFGVDRVTTSPRQCGKIHDSVGRYFPRVVQIQKKKGTAPDHLL